jgi:peptidoglycan/xylan/chitin deacetylase (PgdA/CDA1 family)
MQPTLRSCLRWPRSECVEQNPAVLQREAAEGHEIGNHSWSHPNLANLSDEAVRSQLRRTDDLIVKTAGAKPTLMRPPYGELTKRQRIWVNHDFNYKVILWDVDPLDWKRQDQVSSETALSRARVPAPLFCRTTSIRPRSKRCPKSLTPFWLKASNS